MESLILGLILLMITLHVRTEHRLTCIEQKLIEIKKEKQNG